MTMRLAAVAFALACSRGEPPTDVLAFDSSLARLAPPPVTTVRAPVAPEALAVLGGGTDADPPRPTPAVRIPPYTVVFHQRMIAPPGVLVGSGSAEPKQAYAAARGRSHRRGDPPPRSR